MKIYFCFYAVTLALTSAYYANAANGDLQEQTQNGYNIWNQLVGIMKHAPDTSLEVKNYVNSKKLAEEGRDLELCEVPCANDAVCVAKDTCRCVNNWFGPRCTLFECSQECQHGQCTGPNTCFCQSGWSGSACNKPICNPSCMNGGQCIGPDNCVCTEGYIGSICQDASCDPPCGHGNCFKPNKCTCDPGWQGPLCTEPLCNPPCENDGDCVGPNTCACTSKWRGYTCKTPVCRSRCQNGGKCVAPDVCQCRPKFIGEACQIALDKDAHAGQTCTVWSSYHFRTFDGHAFDFPGLCRYELSFDARDMMFAIELIKNAADFLEEGHGDELDFNRHRENNTETNNMLKETIRNYTGEFMAIELTLRGVKDPFYLLPEKMLLFGEKRIMQRQFTHRGVSIETIGRYLRVRTRVGLTILWDGEGVLDIELDKSLYNGKVAGLCGNFDTDPFNDIVMKDGSKASDLLYFAMAWRVNEIHKDCVDITYIPVYCSNHTSEEIEENRVVCEVIIANLPAFLRCRESGIDPVSFVDACMVDLCRCKKKKKVDCSCNALNQYSRLCAHETGIAPEWRTQDLCGVTCQPGMVYSECSSSCPRTCQNLVTPETECDDHCMDGCACINGTVLRHDNTCVLEEECPCIHNERFYPPGYTIKQECLECQCEGALWNCKSLPCVGECSVVGDSHYTTFDGMVSKIYGECQFTFVKDCNGTDLFTVLVENSFCANGLTETCINEVLVSLTPIASGPSTARTSSISDNRGQIQIRFAKGRRITVDEQEVVLPIFHEHFQIFQASSEFIQFHLNTGIVLEWDGSTRLYVRVERVWMNKLCGICGNFNDNKRDDMMNINGLIEKSATAFSNLWKVNSDCRDATPDINLDPCVAHPQRAEFAKQRCRIIREDLFQKCHSFVSPEEAEQICRQDVCQCDKGVDCLCNAIAHYARQCAKKGQIVHWRTKSFCPVACGGGQIYQPCGSSCLSTCRSISDPRARCSEVCIEGCNCPQNLYLNEYNRCVPKAECQCYHNGKVYKAFYISRREYTSCHCRDGLYTCQNLDDLQIPGSPAEYHNRSICKPGWMHKTCQESADLFDGYPQGIECQKTCKTIDTRCIATECVEGCGCPVDLVLDPDRDVCVDRNECPCYFGGSSYTPGETLKVDCNTCRCERREWICTNDLCVGTCTAYGDPHYLTFDGYKFDFMGECNYILTQDYCGNQEGQFRVYVENTNCGSDSASCTKSVTLILTGTVSIKLNKDVFGYEQHDLVTWGAAPGSHGNYTKVIWDFHHVGLYTIVTTDIGLTIVWDKKTTVYVKLHPKYKGRVCGLCGDFDDNQNNDMIMSDRMLAINPTEFGNSWKQSPSCHDASEQESQCDEHPTRRMWAQRSCQILYSEKFAVCHAVVDVVWYHTNCIYDACACDGGGDCECLCTAIAAYAHACSDEGIKIRWRTPHVCPLMCEGYSEDHDCIWHYSECEDACPQTCQHRYLTTGYDSCPLSVPCVEGCFPYCPEGMFYDEHLKNCVQTCEEGCHANGRFYLYGEVIKREECRVCICEVDGDIICKVTPECKQATSASVPHTAIPTTPEAPSTIAMTTTTSLPTSGFTSSPRTHILGEPKTKRYCAGKVNLNFLLDGSHQISTKDFEITKDVVTALVESIVPYDYGRSNSSLRLAVEQYSEEIEVDMSFEHEQDLTSFVKTLRDMELQNGDSSNLNLALQKVLEMFIEARETNQDKKQKDGASSIEDVLFIIMFSTPDDEFDTTLKEIQNLGVKVIVLPVGSSSNERRMKATLGEDASVHFIEDIFHIVDQTRHDVAMRILEDICTGKPINVSKIIPTPVTTIPTQPPATTTSVIAPFESCTMTADLVVIIDIALLTGDEEDVNNFLNLLKMILSDTLVRPDRTHVTILLADKRVWRIGRFISTRQELLGDLENSILTKVSQKVYAAKHFDLDYALEQATDGYLFNERSGVRGEELNVHKSVLVFQAREAFPQTKDKDIEHKMSLMEQEQVVFSIIIHRKTFRGFRSKNEWKKLMKMKNILFADLATSKVTRTRFSRMMDRVCRTPPKLPMPLIYCQGYTDLYFLWDDSDNIESKDLKNMMRATKKIARSLRFDNFGSDKESPLRIAIAQYSDEVNFLLDTGDHSNLHEFVDAPVPGIPYWSMGSESHLGEALSQIGQKFKAVVSERNKTLVIFTSRISTDPIDQPLNDLLAVGTKIVAIGFSPDSTSKQLKKIAGDSGWFKRLASSREILDNDIGIALADEICLPGIPPPLPTGTTQAVTTPAVITSERYAISTKAALNATTISPPACIMSDDIQILIDSKFTTGDAMSSMVSEVLLQVISELKIDKVSSRVGAAVVGHKVEPASGLNDQGVNKNELLGIFLNLDSQMKSHSPFSLTEAIEMSEEFVFNANPREGEEDYKKDVVLVVDRLPENEIDLFREESLKSVRSTIDNLIEEDYGVYLVYTDKTFQNFTFTLQKKWLKGLEGSSLLLEVTDNPKIFGSELIDMICTVPTMTTAFLKTSLPYTTSTPLFTEKTERTTAKIITPTKEEPLSSTATTEFFTEKTRPKMTSEISTSKNYTSLATTRISKSTEAESTFYQTTSQFFPSTTAPPLSTVPESTTTSIEEIESTQIMSSTSPTEARLGNCTVDLQIILDSSYSIGRKFIYVKEFLLKLIENFDVENDLVRVGLIQYSGGVKSEFQLKDHIRDSSAIVQSIKDMTLLSGTTNTYSAIEYTLDNEISESTGKRSGIPLVILLLTDGRIKDHEKEDLVLEKLEDKRREIQKAGVRFDVMALGIASAREEELLKISSHPEYTSYIGNFKDVFKLVDKLITHVCFPQPTLAPPSTTTREQTTTPPAECAYMPATDLLFILDGSMDLVDSDRLESYQKFLVEMVPKFKIGQSDTQIGVVFYGEEVYNSAPHGFGINEHGNVRQLIGAISKMELPDDFSSEIKPTLKKIFSNAFPGPVEGRESARKVAVVIITVPVWEATGGERLADIFRDATDRGIEVLVAVAPNEDIMINRIRDVVGPYVDSENKIDVSGGVSQLIVKAEDFKQKICGEGPSTTTLTTMTMKSVVSTEKKLFSTSEKIIPATSAIIPETVTSIPSSSTSRIKSRPVSTVSTRISTKEVEVQTTSVLQGCENMPATDVVFVIDGSRSPGMRSNAEDYKTFLKKVVNEFRISFDRTQVSVSTYNDDIFNESPHGFKLSALRTKNEIFELINNLEFPNGYMLNSVEPVAKILQSSFEEILGGRSDARKIAVVFQTSVDTSFLNQNLSSVLENAFHDGIETVYVGISPSSDMPDLLHDIMLSAGSFINNSMKIPVPGGFPDLSSHAYDVRDAICGKLPVATSKEILPTSVTEEVSSLVPEKTTPVTVTPSPLCQDRVDLMFMIDQSFMNSRVLKQAVKEYLHRAFATLGIGMNKVQVSLVIIGSSLDVVLEFDSGSQSREKALEIVDSFFSKRKRYGRLNQFPTQSALTYALNMFSSRHRSEGSTLVMLIRTPLSRPDEEIRAQLTTDSIVVSVIARERARGARAKSLASQGSFYHSVSNLRQLKMTGNRIKEIVCTERPVTPPRYSSPCLHFVADVVFMIDGLHLQQPGSVVRNILVDLVEGFDVGGMVNVAGVSYGNSATVNFKLDSFKTKEQVQKAVKEMQFDGDVTVSDVQGALNFTAQKIIISNSNRRKFVPVYIVNLVGRPVWEVDDFSSILGDLAEQNVFVITLGPGGSHWHNFTVLPNSTFTTFNDTEEFSHFADDLTEILCLQYPFPTATLPVTTSTILTPSEVCTVRNDVLFVVDNNLLHTSSQIEQIRNYFTVIEKKVFMDEMFTRAGLLVTGPNVTVWKRLNENDITLTNALNSKILSAALTGEIQIDLVMDQALFMFDHNSNHLSSKRHLVLLFSREVKGHISEDHWLRLKTLDIALDVITVGTRFLKSDAVDTITYNELPIPSVDYLSNAAFEMVRMLCEDIIIPTPTVPPGITTTSAPFLICPPGDVILMYDSLFLYPESDSAKMKDFLKDIVDIMSNTYAADKTRFALVSFGESPELHFGLDSIKTAVQVKNAIDQSQHHGSDSPLNAGHALNYILNNVMTEQRTVRHVTVLMLISRPSFDNLKAVVQTATDAIDLITFGMGITPSELDELTTIPYGGIPVQDMDKFEDLEYETLELICTVSPVTTTAPPPSVSTTEKPLYPCKVDLMFMLDEDLTTSPKTLFYTKRYLSIIAERLSFNEDYFQVGLMRFSDESSPVTFGFTNTHASFKESVDSDLHVSPVTGSLMLNSGLDSALKEFDRHGRKDDDVMRLIVFILRRQSSHNIDVGKLKTLSDAGIVILSIVIDDAMFIPSSTLTNYEHGYVQAYRPQYLTYFASPVVYTVWNIACVKTKPTALYPTTTPLLIPTTASAPPGVCSRIMDVAFLIDQSLMVDEYKIEITKSFVKDSVRSLDFSPDTRVQKTRVSVIQYSFLPKAIVNLREFYDKSEALKAIESRLSTPEKLSRPQSHSSLVPALSYASKHVLNEEGMRVAEKVIVLLAERPFNDSETDVLSELENLQRMGVALITVGLDSSLRQRINELTTIPDQGVLSFSNIDEMPGLLPTVKEILCEGVPVAPVTTEKFPITTLPYVKTSVIEPKTSISPSPVVATSEGTGKYLNFTEILETTAFTRPIQTTVTQKLTPSTTEETAKPATSGYATSGIPASSEVTEKLKVSHYTTEKVTETTESEIKVEAITPKFTAGTSAESLVVNCDELKLDLLILLQASSHFSKFGSQKMKSISNQLARSFKFGKDNVLISVMQFDDDVTVHDNSDGFQFKDIETGSRIASTIFNLHIHEGVESHPGKALKTVVDNYMTSAQGARADVRKAVVMVVGEPMPPKIVDEFNRAIRYALERGISIFLIIVPLSSEPQYIENAKNIAESLHQLQTNNKMLLQTGFKEFYLQDFDVETLSKDICRDIPRTVPYPEIATTAQMTTLSTLEVNATEKITSSVKTSTAIKQTTSAAEEKAKTIAATVTQETSSLAEVSVKEETSSYPEVTSTTKASTAAEKVTASSPATTAALSQSTIIPMKLSTTAQITPLPVKPSVPVTTPDLCEYPSDTVLVVDTSNVAEQNLAYLQQFLTSIVNKFTDQTNFAIVSYGDTAQVVKTFEDTIDVQTKINSISRTGKFTYTGSALQRAQDLFNEARGDVPWSVLLLTDGRSKDSLQDGIESLRNLQNSHPLSMKFTAVGIQSASVEELNQFADEQNIVYIDTYANLLNTTAVDAVFDALCGPYEKASLPDTSTIVTSAVTSATIGTTTSRVETTPSKTTTIRMTTIMSSTTSYTEVCDCYWTDYISRDKPSPEKPGDDESWVYYESTNDVCRSQYSGYKIQCQSSEGFLQPNFVCNIDGPPPICWSFEVEDGSPCHDYSISVQCCSSACEERSDMPPPPALIVCSREMDVAFLIDTDQSSSMLHDTKNFLNDFTGKMKLRMDYSRVSLVEYGSNGSKLDVSWTIDEREWKTFIDSLQPSPPGDSDVAPALRIVLEQLAPKARIEADGYEVTKVVVLLLTGSSMGAVDGPVMEVQQAGFRIVVIGMNTDRKTLMRRLADDSSSIVTVSDLTELRQEGPDKLVEMLCMEEEETTPPPTSTAATTQTRTQQLLSTTPATGKAFTTEAISAATKAPELRKTTSATTETIITTSPKLKTTEIFTTTVKTIPTTTPTPTCVYYNEKLLQSMIIEFGQVIYPNIEDKCSTIRCNRDGTLTFSNKRLLCEEIPKPKCDNGFEPVLRYDSGCNCQWECQCYCQVSGNSYHTFDGLQYSVQGECSYVLAQATSRAVRSGRSFKIIQRLERCNPNSKKSCVSEVAIQRLNGTVILFRNYTATLNSQHFESNPTSGIHLSIVGHRKFVVNIDDIGLEVKFEPEFNGITVSMPAYIWDSNTEGMCGTCNHDTSDELRLRNKTITTDIPLFARDWFLKQTCEEPGTNVTCVTPSDELCHLIINGSMFDDCRSKVDWERYYRACLKDTCRNPDTVCDILAGFAEACRHSGECVDWRKGVCEITCENGTSYRPCVEPPYQKSCLTKEPVQLTTKELAEGCFLQCEEGEVVIDGKCVSKEYCDKCYDKNSTTFIQPGEFWFPADKPCHVCSCLEDLAIECTRRPCTDKKTIPGCGRCEKISLVAESDTCCPEYECVCTYDGCDPVPLMEPCQDGSMMRILTNTSGCRPIYGCICEIDKCIFDSTSPCTEPMVQSVQNTTCCPKSDCTCPDSCDKDNIICDLGYSKTIHSDICNCSKSECVPMPVCVVSINNRKVIKTLDEEWRDPHDHCIICKCEADKNPNADFYPVTCRNTSEICKPCGEAFRSEYMAEECCPRCIPNACVYTNANNSTTIFLVGDEWPKTEGNICQNLTCVMSGDVPAVIEIIRDCVLTSPGQCDFGFKMKCDTDPCCPECHCVPDEVCNFNDSLLQKPGQSWTVNECMTCECTGQRANQESFYEHVCTNVYCVECSNGFEKREINGTCCGECVPTECTISLNNTLKVLQVDEELTEGCSVAKCIRNNRGYVMSVVSPIACPPLNIEECVHLGGVVGKDEKECCSICQFQQRECQVREGQSVTLTINGCIANRPIMLSYCEGQCASSSHYHIQSGRFVPHCTCCKPVTYDNRTQEATCQDGTTTHILYRHVTGCNCESVMCSEWTRIDKSGKEIVTYRIEPEKSSSSHQNNSNYVLSWTQNNTVNVFEITNVSPNYWKNDVLSVVQETMKKYGNVNLPLQVIEVDASNSSLSESLKEVIKNAINGKNKDV